MAKDLSRVTKAQAYKLYCSITDGRGSFAITDLRLYRGLSERGAVEFQNIKVRTQSGRVVEGGRVVVTQRGYELAMKHYRGTVIAAQIEEAWAAITVMRNELNPPKT